MTVILDAILDFLKVQDGFSRTFTMLFSPYFRSYSENFSLVLAVSSIELMFLFNLWPFWTLFWILGKLQGDSPGLLVCCSTDFSGPILKISACPELVLTYKQFSLKMMAILDAILNFLDCFRVIVQNF